VLSAARGPRDCPTRLKCTVERYGRVLHWVRVEVTADHGVPARRCPPLQLAVKESRAGEASSHAPDIHESSRCHGVDAWIRPNSPRILLAFLNDVG